MAQPSGYPEVIEVPDNNPDDFPDSGPQNLAEAQTYHDKIDEIMIAFSYLLAYDRKDSIEVHHSIPEEVDGKTLVPRCQKPT